ALTGYGDLADAVLSVGGGERQRCGAAVQRLASAVRDLYRSGLSEEGLVERDAVHCHRVVAPYHLPVNLRAVLVQDEVTDVVLGGAVRVVGVVEGHRLDGHPGT